MNRKQILFSGILAFFFSGMLYGWSILKAPLASELGWSGTQLTANFTLTMCMFCIGGMISGFLQHKVPVRRILLAAAVLALLGFWLSSTVQAEDLVRFYLSYGVAAGLAIGLQYNTILSVVNACYADRQGTSSGALLMSFGASALVFGMLADALMHGSFGWRNTYRLIGVLIAATSLYAALVMDHPKTESAAAGKAEETSGADMTPEEMLRRPSFWQLFVFLILAACVGNSTISFARDVALSLGAADSLASFLAGLLSLCNGIGRLFSGMIYDRKGRRFTMTLDGLVTIAAPVLMLGAVLTDSLAMAAVGLCVTGFSYAFQPPITSALTASFYGRKYYSRNYSIVNLMLIPTSLIASLNSALYAQTATYAAPFLLLLAAAVVSFFLNLHLNQA